ncbi:MAG: [Fe-S]-binding protein [Clostridiales bacterium]|nr:[Fe-S]-binding protein [Clostridiales bacterium]
MAKVLVTDELRKCIGCYTCMHVCAAANHRSHSIRNSCISIKTSGGMSGRFVAVVCQTCKQPPCAEACPTSALVAQPGGGVVLDSPKCIGCRRCEAKCIVKAIGYDEDERKPIICFHCGLCVRFCPHGCLEMREVPDEEDGGVA